MGHKHSKQSKCNYDSYNEKYNKLKNKYTDIKIKKSLIDKELKKISKELIIKKGEVEKLKNICMTTNNETIKETGEKIYNLLSNRYKDTINLLNTQKNLIVKQNNLLSDKKTLSEKLTNKITTIDDNIIKNDRLMELHYEDEKHKNKRILYLKIFTFIIFIIFVIVIILNR